VNGVSTRGIGENATLNVAVDNSFVVVIEISGLRWLLSYELHLRTFRLQKKIYPKKVIPCYDVVYFENISVGETGARCDTGML